MYRMNPELYVTEPITNLAAAQESDNTDVTTEKICGALTRPVLNIITT